VGEHKAAHRKTARIEFFAAKWYLALSILYALYFAAAFIVEKSGATLSLRYHCSLTDLEPEGLEYGAVRSCRTRLPHRVPTSESIRVIPIPFVSGAGILAGGNVH